MRGTGSSFGREGSRVLVRSSVDTDGKMVWGSVESVVKGLKRRMRLERLSNLLRRLISSRDWIPHEVRSNLESVMMERPGDGMDGRPRGL